MINFLKTTLTKRPTIYIYISIILHQHFLMPHRWPLTGYLYEKTNYQDYKHFPPTYSRHNESILSQGSLLYSQLYKNDSLLANYSYTMADTPVYRHTSASHFYPIFSETWEKVHSVSHNSILCSL